ncbi:hypothetical protein [Myroides odoratus]|uniref:Uncharacterized protein n=1 Tax=Myroides odoratus TaxID=256 RepID=A0A378RNN0_MYROD|nr:hypothetical protein [Myroides odoratus]QQU04019.1 hypothetical protein I6I89_01615 [Myroides odoratus]STZ28595.1 Uncharacterised protein [Myroides odoratus]
MIQANEVRRGNWIEYDNRFFQIDTIAEVFPTLDTGEFGIGVVDWNNIKPIELTEEMLFKIKDIVQKEGSLGIYYYIKPYRMLRFFFDGTRLVIIKKDGDDIWIANIKYLHQLQNLYFVLTGKELELTL